MLVRSRQRSVSVPTSSEPGQEVSSQTRDEGYDIRFEPVMRAGNCDRRMLAKRSTPLAYCSPRTTCTARVKASLRSLQLRYASKLGAAGEKRTTPPVATAS